MPGGRKRIRPEKNPQKAYKMEGDNNTRQFEKNMAIKEFRQIAESFKDKQKTMTSTPKNEIPACPVPQPPE